MPEGMRVEIEVAALHMMIAVAAGGLIGVERQARQRMAGIRTNALVALGAASFMTFSLLFPGDPNQTRVAAQIISGIGFLGAGLIFREGSNVHGLNTAATLWCSAAVGMMAGAGALELACLLTGIVLVLNIFLRPLVNWLDVTMLAGKALQRRFRVRLVCRPEREAELRALAVRMLMQGKLRLDELDARLSEDGAGIELVAILSGEGVEDAVLERAIALLAIEPGLSHADWKTVEAG